MTRLLLALGAIWAASLAVAGYVAWLKGRARGWHDWTGALIDDPTLARMYCDHDDPADDVQPPDPRTTRPVVVTLPSSLTPAEVGHIRTWLDAHPDVVTELYESEPIRTRPLGGM